MAGKIFINYRRDDSDAYALAVARYLGKRNIFIDVDRFKTVLEDKLRQCKVMLAIIGPNWVDARDEKTGNRRIDDPEYWVRVEIERALARKIPVMPVLVAGATLPSKSDLPPSLQPLLKHQGTTLTKNGFRHEMAGLAHDVTNLTVRRPWGRMVAAASALILGGYVVAHQFGESVWWRSFGLGQPNLLEEAPKPSKEADSTPKRDADAAEAAPPDPALSVTPGSGKTFRDPLADGKPCPTCPEMVVAPAGTFTMGSSPSDPERGSGEEQVRVTIARPFVVGKFAVTFDQWDACVADGGCNGYRPKDGGWGRGNRPVINVNWADANAYAEWLSQKTGKTYRLLSEAEH